MGMKINKHQHSPKLTLSIQGFLYYFNQGYSCLSLEVCFTYLVGSFILAGLSVSTKIS
eukprot:gene239-117_t